MASLSPRRAFFCLMLGMALVPLAIAQGKKSEGVVKATAREGAASAAKGGKRLVLVELEIEKGWHLYANPAGNEDLDSVKTTVTVVGEKAEVVYPKGKQVIDPVVGNYVTYEGKQTIQVYVPADKKGPLKMHVSFQACDEKTCLQPAKVTVELK